MSLYHYTDVNAVRSIVENQRIWLTDSRFLNDKEEHKSGLDNFKKILESGEKFEKFSKESRRYLSDYLFSPTNNLEPIFIFSLSESNDLLSQWRSYGSYAVEFDKLELSKSFPDIHECCYDEGKDQKTIEILTAALEVIDTHVKKGEKYRDGNSDNALIKAAKEAASFKHKAFSEEKEHRLIKRDTEKVPVGGGFSTSNIRYRSRGKILIPYLEIVMPINCIKSIKIGPIDNQDLACISMQSFVNNHPHKKLWNDQNIPVTTSSAPYRNF